MGFRFPRAALAGVLVLGGFSAAIDAHHSFSAMYDAAKPVRLVGTLSKVEWTNPHSYFHIDVKGKDGKVTTWACEGAGPGALSRRGFNKTDIKVGDTLIVDGYLAKSGGHIIDARRVTLPNGRVVSGGTPGDGGPEEGGGKPPHATDGGLGSASAQGSSGARAPSTSGGLQSSSPPATPAR